MKLLKLGALLLTGIILLLRRFEELVQTDIRKIFSCQRRLTVSNSIPTADRIISITTSPYGSSYGGGLLWAETLPDFPLKDTLFSNFPSNIAPEDSFFASSAAIKDGSLTDCAALFLADTFSVISTTLIA